MFRLGGSLFGFGIVSVEGTRRVGGIPVVVVVPVRGGVWVFVVDGGLVPVERLLLLEGVVVVT